jgi:hypothetical protein
LDKENLPITSGIKHWGLGGYASVLPRIKFSVTGQDSSPQSPTFHTADRCAKVFATLRLLHIVRRITSVDAFGSLRSTFNTSTDLQNYFTCKLRLQFVTSQIRRTLAVI